MLQVRFFSEHSHAPRCGRQRLPQHTIAAIKSLAALGVSANEILYQLWSSAEERSPQYFLIKKDVQNHARKVRPGRICVNDSQSVSVLIERNGLREPIERDIIVCTLIAFSAPLP